MTERTPEQVAADNAIEDAISKVTAAYDLVDLENVVTAWMLVGAAQGADYGMTHYFHAYPSGNLPTHVAVGLLRMTEHQLLNPDADDDDE